ncbi:uncharacterized protein LOC135129959 [Zophobas morio]|uniref:uncharacterized protein LOC135129959 n=1 Tax=Zophobas morio TaxID=2755281 RepID=UPI0030827303
MPMESEDEYENDSDDEWEPNRDDYLDNSQDHEDSVTGSNVDDTTADDDISEGPEDLNDQTTSIYTGHENDPNTRPIAEPDLGASANIVLRLDRDIPKFQRDKLYFDNFYTSLDLVIYLHKQEILPLGTIKAGTSVEYVTDVESVEVPSLAWNDNKIVHLMSSFCGQLPETPVKRFDRKTKEHIEINCPQIIKIYNKHMGGVDALDSHIGRHRIKIKSKKCGKVKTIQPSNQKKFRSEITQCLCRLDKSSAKRGRPSGGIQESLGLKKKRNPAAIIPPLDVRTNKIDHWPEWIENRGRCKFPGCKGLTYVHCNKCRLPFFWLNKSDAWQAGRNSLANPS